MTMLKVKDTKAMTDIPKPTVKIPKPIIRTISVWSILEYMQALLDKAHEANGIRFEEYMKEYNAIKKMLDKLDGGNHDN